MPGIVGILASAPSPAYERQVRQMVATMQHHPNSVSGLVFAPDLGAYGGWVAHEGSFAARQAASAAPGTAVSLLFGGECYASDTPADVSLSGRYDARGEAFVADLNGLFAGLLIDRARRRVLLFNDRYGSERLYAFDKAGVLYFASEAKALLSVVPELRAWDEQGVAQFLKFGSTIDGRTLFRGIRFLPGGSLWRFEAGSLRKDRYFDPGTWENVQPLDEDTFERRFSEVFRDRLSKYLVAEKGLGISVTGGLDTRMIMACLPKYHANAVCYTYAGREGETLDVRLGRRVAESCGLKHHVLRIGEDFLRGFGQYVDRTVYVTDGCAGPLHAHEIYFTRLAARLAPVRVTGNFGSEVFRSVSTFKRLELAQHLLSPALRRLIDSVDLPLAGHHPVRQAAFMEIPWHLFGTLAAARSELTVRTPYLDNHLVELAFKAPTSARRSTSAAFKLIQSMNERLGAIPTDQGRTAAGNDRPTELMRHLYCAATFKADYWDTEGLPISLSPAAPLLKILAWLGLLGQHKYLPYRAWFRHELSAYVQEVLTDSHTRRSPFWDADGLARLASDHANGRRNCLREIHAVLALDAVERTLLRQTVTEPDLRATLVAH